MPLIDARLSRDAKLIAAMAPYLEDFRAAFQQHIGTGDNFFAEYLTRADAHEFVRLMHLVYEFMTDKGLGPGTTGRAKHRLSQPYYKHLVHGLDTPTVSRLEEITLGLVYRNLFGASDAMYYSGERLAIGARDANGRYVMQLGFDFIEVSKINADGNDSNLIIRRFGEVKHTHHGQSKIYSQFRKSIDNMSIYGLYVDGLHFEPSRIFIETDDGRVLNIQGFRGDPVVLYQMPFVVLHMYYPKTGNKHYPARIPDKLKPVKIQARPGINYHAERNPRVTYVWFKNGLLHMFLMFDELCRFMHQRPDLFDMMGVLDRTLEFNIVSLSRQLKSAE